MSLDQKVDSPLFQALDWAMDKGYSTNKVMDLYNELKKTRPTYAYLMDANLYYRLLRQHNKEMFKEIQRRVEG